MAKIVNTEVFATVASSSGTNLPKNKYQKTRQ